MPHDPVTVAAWGSESGFLFPRDTNASDIQAFCDAPEIRALAAGWVVVGRLAIPLRVYLRSNRPDGSHSALLGTKQAPSPFTQKLTVIYQDCNSLLQPVGCLECS